MNQRKINYLRAMGIQPWTLKITPHHPTQAKLMVIAESKPGPLLDSMLQAISIELTDVVILTVANQSREWITQKINNLKPALILALGEAVGKQLQDSDFVMETFRGKIHVFQGVPLIVTYDLAHLTQHPTDKRNAYSDLCLAVETLR